MTSHNSHIASSSPSTLPSEDGEGSSAASNFTLVTTLNTLSTNHGIQVDYYDYELVDGTESRHQCPICLACLRDPVLTICGHRFCSGCIHKWVVEHGGKCPMDLVSLPPENIFPDNFTRREIMACKAKCLFPSVKDSSSSCDIVLPVSDMERHIETEHKGSNLLMTNGGSGLLECPFKDVGCTVNFQEDQREKHLEKDSHRHLQLFRSAYSTEHALSCSRWEYPGMGDGQSFPGVGGSEPNLQDVFHRVAHLKQKDRESETEIEKLQSELKQVLNVASSSAQMINDFTARDCNEVLKIANFRQICQDMRLNRKRALFLPGIYTGTFGYKLCLRFQLDMPALTTLSRNVTTMPVDVPLEQDEDTCISLFVHFMQGEFDDKLHWPFHGEIKLMIIHPTHPEDSVIELMSSKPGAAAFAKPTLPRNPMGYGYMEFCPMHKIFANGFIKDDTLVFKILAKSLA